MIRTYHTYPMLYGIRYVVQFKMFKKSETLTGNKYVSSQNPRMCVFLRYFYPSISKYPNPLIKKLKNSSSSFRAVIYSYDMNMILVEIQQ